MVTGLSLNVEDLGRFGASMLYCVDLTQEADPEVLRSFLPSQEWDVVRHILPEGRRRRLLSRVARRLILRDALTLGQHLADIPIVREPGGRPVLRDGPSFSVTGTGIEMRVDDVMYMAVAKEAEQVGLDVEYLSRNVRDLPIPDENTARWIGDSSARRLRYHTWWEAASKIDGHGMRARRALRFLPPTQVGASSSFERLEDFVQTGSGRSIRITPLVGGRFQERRHNGRTLTIAWSVS